MSAELEIIVLKPGGGLAGSFVLADQRIVIGRDKSAHVVLNDASIAPKHAVVHFTGRSCIIEPIDGAKLIANGERVESHLITAKDSITLGNLTLRFVVHRDAEPVEREPDPERTTVMQMPMAVAQQAQKVSPKPPPHPQHGREPPPRVTVSPAAKLAAVPKHASEVEFDPPTKVIQVPKTKKAPEPPSFGNLALARPHAEYDADDDDDEDDEPFYPFSLIQALQEVAKSSPTGRLVVEAVAARDGRVHRITHVKPGATVRMPPPTSLHCTFEKTGAFIIRANIKLQGRATKAGTLVSFYTLMKRGADGDELHVEPGTIVELQLNERDTLLLHHVGRAELQAPPKPLFEKPPKELQRAVSASFIAHLLAFMAIGLFTGKNEGMEQDNQGRFVEVQIKDMELEPPPPKPPEPEPVAPEPTPQPVAKQKPTPQPRTPQPKAPPSPAPPAPAPPQKSAAASNLLAALSSPAPQSTSNALAAATNLDAVAAPKGAGFKVSGVIGKMPGNELRLGAAGSGIGRVDTKSANELTRGGALGRVQGSAPSGKVRGVVEGPPARSVQVQGQLDRSEIQKVVNDHLHEVQGCYERQLVKDPSLSGKIVSEWVITPAGTVGTVKIKSSSVRNNEVANCIQNALKRWKFPQPKGGPVTVTYPFVFSTIGM